MMAAYAALLSLTQIIRDIDNHPLPPISLHKQQVETLTEKATFLQGFLESYSSSSVAEADPLEMRIAAAAYKAEDLIESYIANAITAAARREEVKSYLSKGRFRTILGGRYGSGGEQAVSCIDFYGDLGRVIEEMDSIERVAATAEAAADDQPRQRNISAVRPALRSCSAGMANSSAVFSDGVLYGIMEKLVSGRLGCQVISIVGMGVIGKTTLARTVYSQPLIKEHFHVYIWATISQQYSTRDILCQLLSRKEEASRRSSEDELGSELYKCLCGRRFLVVMDDMWSIDAWNEIRCFFPNNDNGSRILVTTRLSQLSSQLNNSYSHQMEFLDKNGSWDLFSKTVFGEESCPLELVGIGKEIVKGCRGLPLSIVVVGGLLKKRELTRGCWESIRNNLASVVSLEYDERCLRLLEMSYNHLPLHLKPCFLYMGVFEEDYRIHVSMLIKLWVSEGFLKPMDDGKSLKTIAKGFLKDLVDRNLILIDELGSTGNIKCCKIHDLLRDLCLRESRKYEFYHVIGEGRPRGVNSKRRVVIRRGTSELDVVLALESISNTRSIIYEDGSVSPRHEFGLLRTLHAYHNPSNQRYEKAFKFECVNLRHLAIEVSSMSSFIYPSNLVWNLQTLIVYCWIECSVPVGIWKIPQLRHIEFVSGFLHLPSNDVVQVMGNLETLKGVSNFKCGEEVVRRIPNVRKLGMRYWDNGDDYGLQNIERLHKLESLDIFCVNMMEGVHASLHKLTIPNSLLSLSVAMNDSEFECEEMLGKTGSLPLLQKLKLIGACFGGGEWEIGEGQFPCLKFLSLGQCHGLKHWTVRERSILPRLELLRLVCLKELEEIPSEIGDMPTLRKIELELCSKQVVMSTKAIVEEQAELQGDKQLPFHVVVRALKNEAPLSLAGPNFEVITMPS